MWNSLDADERRYLIRCPSPSGSRSAAKRYLPVHATPRDPLDEYLLKDPNIWARRVQNAGADIVCVGHSHMQFNLAVEGTVILNPGSVGLPRDGDPRAAYAIIDDNRIELKRVPYPVEETIRRIEATDWPRRAKDLMTQVLRTGRLAGPVPDPSAESGSGADRADEPDDDPRSDSLST
ncbi:MAG: metallophosphoesterase family protein [Isosphaeraceae bacterium]